MLYLASTSPRRSALLTDAGIGFESIEPGPEPTDPGQPAVLARTRAAAKARVPVVPSTGFVLGVDTVVDLDGQTLGKPPDAAAAAFLLRALSGQVHQVHTGHCLVRVADGARFERLETSTVRCAPLSAEAIDAYVQTEAWRGKAGGYGLQDEEAWFVELMGGAADTVIGLSVLAVRRLLEDAS